MINFFRQLRWKLTLSYIPVTVGAFLVAMLVLGVILTSQIFLPNNYMSPEGLIEVIRDNASPLFSSILSQSPINTQEIHYLLKNSKPSITSVNFLRIGSLQFSVNMVAQLRVLIIGADGILLGNSDPGLLPSIEVGEPFDINLVPGLESPFNAALTVFDARHLYTILDQRNGKSGDAEIQRYILAVPIFSSTTEVEKQVLGILVAIMDSFPAQRDIPAQILMIAGRSLLFFFLGLGVMGGIFGVIFARGLTERFKRLSTITDQWSAGNFSKYINDTSGDIIGKFSRRLDEMARQLQSLLHNRQEMAISEERNRLARELHDSAKQQALAASFEIGAALTLYERDPINAKKHLKEADTLVDSVRNELTNLVHELRPQALNGQDFSEILREYALEWSQRSRIEVTMNADGDEKLSLGTRGTLFRIEQEALANVARHSSASSVDLTLAYETDTVKMIIKDDGIGFDMGAQHGGLGLKSMRERAEVLGGSFIVESTPNHGTQIMVTLPKVGE